MGKVSKGTDQKQLDDLPTCTYGEAKAKGETFAILGEQCAVCRCEYDDDDIVRILPCRHAEHAECLDQWLLRNRSCPLCQRDVGTRAGASPASAGAFCSKTRAAADTGDIDDLLGIWSLLRKHVHKALPVAAMACRRRLTTRASRSARARRLAVAQAHDVGQRGEALVDVRRDDLRGPVRRRLAVVEGLAPRPLYSLVRRGRCHAHVCAEAHQRRRVRGRLARRVRRVGTRDPKCGWPTSGPGRGSASRVVGPSSK